MLGSNLFKSAGLWLFALFACAFLVQATPVPVPGILAKVAGKEVFPATEKEFKSILNKGALTDGKLPVDKSFFFSGTTGGAPEVKALKDWAVKNDLQHVTGILKPGYDKPKRFAIPEGGVKEELEDKYWNELSGFYTKWSSGKAYVAIPGGKDGIAKLNPDSIFMKTEIKEMEKAESGITDLFVMDSKNMPSSLADVTDKFPLNKATASSSSGAAGKVEDGVDKITDSLDKIL